MSDLRELYQEVILDHYRKPRHFAAMDDADRKAEGYNPLCGDRVAVYLRLNGDVVEEASFQGSGCAISTASASLMTAAIQGKTLAEVEALFEQFHDLVTGAARDPATLEGMGELEALGGVRDYPVRIKCATLAWHALHSALEERDQTTSTE